MSNHGDPISSGSSNPPPGLPRPRTGSRGRGRASPGETAAKGPFWPRSGSRTGRVEPPARAGQAVLLPLPNSGTARRAEALHHLQLAGLLGAGGEALSGSLLGGIASLAAPALVGRGLLSRPVQAYLGNRAAANAPRLAARRRASTCGFAACSMRPTKGRATVYSLCRHSLSNARVRGLR
jgi:hypothetical protein